jgi:bacteriocin-like protein
MTDLNSENSELRSEELTIDELDSVSGGRMKIPGKIVTAAEIAKLAADNPGFV